MNSLLLIDDNEDVLNDLEQGLRLLLPEGEADICKWVPKGAADSDGRTAPEGFREQIKNGPILVVTDYDLTGQGFTGLFGASIVAWCQAQRIPVGDYSRGQGSLLPKEPDLFDIRVPTSSSEAASYIAAIYRGFVEIKTWVTAHKEEISGKGNPAAVIADFLGQPELESAFALYSVRLGAISGALMQHVRPENGASKGKGGDSEKRELLGYIVGHLLLNGILRFPGPILSKAALMAYVGVDATALEALSPIFGDAKYRGPFADIDSYYWLDRVDAILQPMIEAMAAAGTAQEPETHGELHRTALEQHLDKGLGKHDCARCRGKNGGFLCPFTGKTVCLDAECSVGANSWIPQGASICRIQKQFYDEWAPILGL